MADRFAAKAAAKPLHSRVCEKRAIWCDAARAYPVGLCQGPAVPAGTNQAGSARISPGAAGSNEGESQKAGAKKGKSRRGQGKKAIGNEVLISHHTPSDLDARWNLLKLSERPFRKKRSTLPPKSNPRTDSVKRMGQENSGADQTHYCRHCLNHCQRPLRPCATENGGDLAQSKRFPVASTQSRSTEDSAQQVFQNRAGWRLREARSSR